MAQCYVNSMTASFYSSLHVNVEFRMIPFQRHSFFFLISHKQRWCGLIPFRDNALACLWYGHKNAHRIRSETLFFSLVNPKTDVQSLLFVTLMDIVISRIYKIMTLCVLSDNEVAAIFYCNFHAVWFCIIKIQWAIRSFLQKVTKTNEPGTPTEKGNTAEQSNFRFSGKVYAEWSVY